MSDDKRPKGGLKRIQGAVLCGQVPHPRLCRVAESDEKIIGNTRWEVFIWSTVVLRRIIFIYIYITCIVYILTQGH